MKLFNKILKFLGFQKDKVLDEILNDPIKSYEMMDLINDYKKTIVDGKKDTDKLGPHHNQINVTNKYSLVEI
jgi:hypothetical protein